MRKSRNGCCSGCLWVIALLLLTSSWLNSSWPLRAVELLIGVVVLVAAGLVQARRTGKSR